MFYSTAFFIEPNYEALKIFAQTSLKNNKLFGFNLAAEEETVERKEEILHMITFTDFLFCNRDEALVSKTSFGAELGLESQEVTD